MINDLSTYPSTGTVQLRHRGGRTRTGRHRQNADRGRAVLRTCKVHVGRVRYMYQVPRTCTLYEVDPGKSGLRLGQAVRAEGSASDVRVIAVRLVYM